MRLLRIPEPHEPDQPRFINRGGFRYELVDRPAMHQRVADALAMEFNDEDARWATDSVIEAVFGRDDWNER